MDKIDKVKKARSDRLYRKNNLTKIKKVKKKYYENNKTTIAAKQKIYRNKNRNKLNAQTRLWRKTKAGFINSLYLRNKHRNLNAGFGTIPYSLAEFKDWLNNESSFESLWKIYVNSGYLKNLAPSVDRLNDYQGYSLSNIQIITWEDNDAKGHKDRLEGRNNKISKAVIQYDLNENFINEFVSAMEAKRQTKISNTHIGLCCRGIRKTAGGYVWKYKN